eukprot:COSAG02_NODE_857_length_16462_cov_4.801381_17_plen_162_part_00
MARHQIHVVCRHTIVQLKYIVVSLKMACGQQVVDPDLFPPWCSVRFVGGGHQASAVHTSPNSFWMTASFRPWSADRIRLSSVVLPAPRNPVRIVTGIRSSGRGPPTGASHAPVDNLRACHAVHSKTDCQMPASILLVPNSWTLGLHRKHTVHREGCQLPKC